MKEGCGRTGEKVCASRCSLCCCCCCHRRRHHLRLLTAPAALASSVAVLGECAQLLPPPPPPRFAAPGPTNTEGGRSGGPRKEGGWVGACVVLPESRYSRRGGAPRAVARGGIAALEPLCPAPALGWNLWLFKLFFIFLDRLGFRIYGFLLALIQRGGVTGRFGLDFIPHTPTPPLSPHQPLPVSCTRKGRVGGN